MGPGVPSRGIVEVLKKKKGHGIFLRFGHWSGLIFAAGDNYTPKCAKRKFERIWYPKEKQQKHPVLVQPCSQVAVAPADRLTLAVQPCLSAQYQRATPILACCVSIFLFHLFQPRGLLEDSIEYFSPPRLVFLSRRAALVMTTSSYTQ